MDTHSVTNIVDTIEDEIVTGQLRPGELLHQEALADRFGVSRQPVRTALEILGAKELVTRRPNRSIAVHELPSNAGEEILVIRRLLEPEALTLAIDLFTEQDLLLARQELEKFELEPDPKKLAQRDVDFHLALYRPCQNTTLLKLIADLRLNNIRTYLGQPLGSKARQACIDAHRKILAACAKRDRDKALSLLLAHFSIAKDRTE